MDNREMKEYKSFETTHQGRVSVALFPKCVLVGMTTLGCTVDLHLTLEEAEKLTAVLVELLGKHNAKTA